MTNIIIIVIIVLITKSITIAITVWVGRISIIIITSFCVLNKLKKSQKNYCLFLVV